MAELSEQQKEHLIILLARFRGPAEVVVAMREEFRLELGIPQVVKYDPTRPSYEAGDKWRPIFEAARESYINDVKAVPAANQAFRLNELQALYEKAKKAKNTKLAADLLEQIAREVGGVLTNSRDLNINDARRPRDMSSEDRAALLGSIISEAIQAKQQPTKH